MNYAGLDWDQGNIAKCQKHGMALNEVESLFDGVIDVFPDMAHSDLEDRLIAVGQTRLRRFSLVVFTLRDKAGEIYIRPISAGFMHDREVTHYEKQKTKAAKTKK